MDLKQKIRTYNFWISLSAAILIVVRLVGQSLGFVVDSVLFMDIATAVCGVLVVLGIIIMPASQQTTKKDKKSKDKQDSCESQVCTDEKTTEGEQIDCESTEPAQQTAQEQEVQAEQTDMEKEEEVAVKLAIEELAKNPTELYELVKLLVKNK